MYLRMYVCISGSKHKLEDLTELLCVDGVSLCMIGVHAYSIMSGRADYSEWPCV